MTTILELQNVSIHFGGLTAVDSLEMSVEQGSINSLIGPNGAGKSTVFNLITGFYEPNSGQILYKGKKINGLKTHSITSLGIARTFQNIRLFGALSVLDNVKIGCHSKSSSNLLGAIFRPPGTKKEEQWIASHAQTVLETMELYDKRDELAQNLSYGEQRRLEIARAMASEPALLLLDEPAAGMNPQEKQTLMKMISIIQNKGITIFLVEHDMKFVMSLSQKITVLDYGKKIASGTPEEIKVNPEVIAAYLGQEVS